MRSLVWQLLRLHLRCSKEPRPVRRPPPAAETRFFPRDRSPNRLRIFFLANLDKSVFDTSDGEAAAAHALSTATRSDEVGVRLRQSSATGERLRQTHTNQPRHPHPLCMAIFFALGGILELSLCSLSPATNVGHLMLETLDLLGLTHNTSSDLALLSFGPVTGEFLSDGFLQTLKCSPCCWIQFRLDLQRPAVAKWQSLDFSFRVVSKYFRSAGRFVAQLPLHICVSMSWQLGLCSHRSASASVPSSSASRCNGNPHPRSNSSSFALKNSKQAMP